MRAEGLTPNGDPAWDSVGTLLGPYWELSRDSVVSQRETRLGSSAWESSWEIDDGIEICVEKGDGCL